ncbi:MULTISPECIES: hypothetical protein [Ruegeria]|uniref:hypothetical protein n=1 Tax=Ruegeria TaxID=97050 RepID=UPI0014800E7B|nr:hypothetical protein [Ruegeria lacuscaerulensis]
MLRSTLNLASFCLFGMLMCVAILMLGFFASPEAVRSAPPAQYNSLLLEVFSDR